jgi:endonuclease/exonuclease/phosphatase family metal-dependent hydrolase
LAPPEGLPWPERVLSTRIDAPFGALDLYNAYVPLGEHPDDIKVRTLEALHAALARPLGHHRILCGDLNAPRVEYADGRVLTWAQNEPTGSIQRARGPRFDAAERNIILGLAEHDLADAFRAQHGYAVPAESRAAVNRGRRYPRRLDHILSSRSLGMIDVRYVNEWQHPAPGRPALSDHAAMVAEFEPLHF